MRRLAENSWRTMTNSAAMLECTPVFMLSPTPLRRDLSNSTWGNCKNWIILQPLVEKKRSRTTAKLHHLTPRRMAASHLWREKLPCWAKSPTPLCRMLRLIWKEKSWARLIIIRRWARQLQATLELLSQQLRRQLPLPMPRRNGWEESEELRRLAIKPQPSLSNSYEIAHILRKILICYIYGKVTHSDLISSVNDLLLLTY